MTEFQITRYLQKWWWIIALLSVVSGIFFYAYISSKQTYRAQIMIEFINDQASEGLYPSGDEIDVQEIRSSSVIVSALESIGSGASVDSVRSRLSIAANVSEQDAAIQSAKWTGGEAYDFFPTQYIITYTSLNTETSTDARRVLEAVVDSYILLYSDKYVSISKVPNSVESLQNLNYDYIEWVETIDSFIRSDMNYLSRMKGMRSPFRSSTTGYNFQDLYNEYSLVYNVYLPSLYSLILNNHVTTDRDLLRSRYEYRINQNNLAIVNYQESLDQVEEMIESYTVKNRETMDYHWHAENSATEEGNAQGNNYVLGQVYDFEGRDNYSSEQTTYDSIIDRYIELRSDITTCEADIDYCNYILSSFRDSSIVATQAQVDEVEALITMVESRLRTLDSLLNATAAEHSEVETIRNVRVRSTVNVKQVTNVKLYTVMIVAVFFVMGVLVAVVLGRGQDFVDYRFYTDPSTNLPNRMRCDNEISHYSNKVLPIPFTCAAIQLTNINAINEALGREGGNEVLRIFAGYIKQCADGFGFVGYNGSLQFMGLFPECDEDRATFYRNMLTRIVAEFNRGGHGAVIRFKIATVSATEKTPLMIHELISSTMRQLRIEQEVIAEEQESAAPAAH